MSLYSTSPSLSIKARLITVERVYTRNWLRSLRFETKELTVR